MSPVTITTLNLLMTMKRAFVLRAHSLQLPYCSDVVEPTKFESDCESSGSESESESLGSESESESLILECESESTGSESESKFTDFQFKSL